MRLRELLERLVRFGLVGGVATGVQYVILVALVRGTGMWPPAASALGFVVSAAGNYWSNYHFTFGSRQPHAPAALKFLILAGVGLVLNAALMAMLVDLGWHYLVAQVCVTAVVFLWNFIGNSLWTFRAYTGP
jgi:putative flippase GtrA